MLALSAAALPVGGGGVREAVGPALPARHRQALDTASPVLHQPSSRVHRQDVPPPHPPRPPGEHRCAARLGDPIEAVLVTGLAVEAVLAEVKVVAGLALEPWPRDGGLAAAIAGHIGVEAWHNLHLADEPGPVALHGEVHCDVASVGTDGGDDAHAAMVHTAPLVLGGRDGGSDPHPVADLDGLSPRHTQGLSEQLYMDIAHPVGPSLTLPHHLHVEVVQAVPVQLSDAANVALVDLLVGPAAAHSHPCLDVVPHVAGILVVGLEVCPLLKAVRGRKTGGPEYTLACGAGVYVLKGVRDGFGLRDVLLLNLWQGGGWLKVHHLVLVF